MTVLVDTSIWSLMLRRRRVDLGEPERAVTQALVDLIQDSRAQLMGMVRQELLSGIRDQAQFRQIRGVLRHFPDAQLGIEDYELAGSMSNSCRSQGVASTVTDMLICAVSSRRGWQVFTRDRDFERYEKVLPIVRYAHT